MQRSLEICALNIKCHPHPEGIYKKLLLSASKLRKPVDIGNNDALLLLENLEIEPYKKTKK